MSLIISLSKIATAGSLLALAGAACATTLQELPKGAHPGECFSHAVTPATYRTVREPVAQPPLVSWREIPAVYKTATRQVLVTPGRVDHEPIPELTGTRVKWVEHPGADRLVEAPPVYRWEERRVLVTPAHLEWRPGQASGGYAQGYGQQTLVRPTGEVMCRVRVPARYGVRRVRVLVTPARTCVVKGPSTRERVVEHFVVRPARVIDHPVAPVYRTVTDRVLVSPARRERVETPQASRYVEKRVEATPAHTGWTRINCAPPKPVYGRPAVHSYPAPHPMPEAQPGYGQPYVPDYARPRPGQPETPAQPGYHAPQGGGSYGAG